MRKTISAIFPASTKKRLAWSHKIADDLAQFDDGAVMQVVALEGTSTSTFSNAQINQMARHRQLAMEPVFKDGYEWTHTLFRRRTRAHRPIDAPSTFARELGRKWADGLDEDGYYRNNHYLSVIRRGFDNGLQRQVNKAARKIDKDAISDDLTKEITLDVAAMAENLSEYRPRILGLKRREDGLIVDEVASFLYAACNAGLEVDVAATMAPLKQVTPSSWSFFGSDMLQISPPIKSERRLAIVISANNFDGGTRSNLMDSIAAIDGEVIFSQSSRVMNRLPFLKSLTRELNRLYMNNAVADERIDELRRLVSALDTNRIRVIEHAMRVICLGRTIEELDKTVRSTVQCLGNAGITCEALSNRKAMHDYFASLPGNHSMSNTLTQATTENVRGLFSFPNEFKHNPGTDGRTLFSFPHVDGSEHDFCPWVNGVPHMFMLGPNGSGKTTLLGKILSAFTSFGARIFALDRDQGLRTLILALGGSYRTIKPGSPLPNPLGLDDSPETRDFLVSLFELMGTAHGTATAEESEALNAAVNMVYRKPMAERSLGDIVFALEGKPGAEDLALRIKQYLPEGRYGWLFAETPAEIEFSDIQGFDTTYLLERPEIAKVGLNFLFHHLDLITDGRLLIVPIDEGWSAVDNEVIEDKAKSVGATARKQEIVFIFMTQSPDHVKDSTARGSIIDNTFTKFYFPHREVSSAAMKEVFDIPPWIIDIVRNMPSTSRAVVMSQDGHYSVHHLNLGAQPEDIAVMSTRKRYLPILDRTIDTYGSDPDIWVPHFQQEVLAS